MTMTAKEVVRHLEALAPASALRAYHAANAALPAGRDRELADYAAELARSGNTVRAVILLVAACAPALCATEVHRTYVTSEPVRWIVAGEMARATRHLWAIVWGAL